MASTLKQLNLNLDYKVPPPTKEGETNPSPVEMSADYIQAAVMNAHQQGMEGQLRRIYGRIQRKMDDAVLNGGVLELENAEVDLLKKSFKEAKFMPQFSKYINVLEDEMEKAFK